MIFRQFVDDGLGCASYLIGDEEEGTAVIIDPAYAIEQYLDEAELRDVKLTRVLETHTHADHLSGHGRLALDHGCTVHIHRAAEAQFAHELLEDNSVVELGPIKPTHPLKLKAAFGRHGIDANSRVVLYSIGTPMWATRFWWMLKSLSFERAAVLDGGFDKWKAEERPLDVVLGQAAVVVSGHEARVQLTVLPATLALGGMAIGLVYLFVR